MSDERRRLLQALSGSSAAEGRAQQGMEPGQEELCGCQNCQHYTLYLRFDDQSLLALLKSPPPPLTQGAIVGELLLRMRRLDVLRGAVEQGMVSPGVDVPQDCKRLPMMKLVHGAAVAGAVGFLRFLIFEQGVDPNEQGPDDWRPLHFALCNKHKHAALFLINQAQGCDVNARGQHGVTPLIFAAAEGMVEVVKALVAKGAEVDAEDEFGQTAITFALVKGHESTALYLLEEARAGLYFSFRRPGGRILEYSMVSAAAMSPLSPASLVKPILRRMRADGLADAVIAAEIQTAASHAIRNGNLHMLKPLLEEGLDLKRGYIDEDGVQKAFLHDACATGSQELVAFLCDHGCDPFEGNGRNAMPHHAAAVEGHTAILQWLRARYPTIPLDARACACSACVNEEGKEDRAGASTALHMAAVRGHLDTVQWLVGQGADPLQTLTMIPRNGEGMVDVRASALAEMGGHPDVAAFLREAEAAAAKRARNQRERERRKAKAQRRKEAREQGQEQAADGEEAEAGEGMVAAMAGLAIGGAGGAALAGQQQEEQEEEAAHAARTPPRSCSAPSRCS
jgi:ankyrin repeat protein